MGVEHSSRGLGSRLRRSWLQNGLGSAWTVTSWQKLHGAREVPRGFGVTTVDIDKPRHTMPRRTRGRGARGWGEISNDATGGSWGVADRGLRFFQASN
jgi:hypothetical protein